MNCALWPRSSESVCAIATDLGFVCVCASSGIRQSVGYLTPCFGRRRQVSAETCGFLPNLWLASVHPVRAALADVGRDRAISSETWLRPNLVDFDRHRHRRIEGPRPFDVFKALRLRADHLRQSKAGHLRASICRVAISGSEPQGEADSVSPSSRPASVKAALVILSVGHRSHLALFFSSGGTCLVHLALSLIGSTGSHCLACFAWSCFHRHRRSN